MNLENKVLSALITTREAFLRLVPYLDTSTFTYFGLQVYKEVEAFYLADPKAKFVDKDLIKSKLIKEKPKNEGLIVEYFASLPEPPSLENLVKLYEDQAKD